MIDPAKDFGEFMCSRVFHDGGGTWRHSRDELTVDSGGKVLESGAIEPAAVELADGRVWLAIRTQTGYVFESHSSDGGDTWSPARPTRFRATNCPVNVLRLRSGSLLFIWNNELGAQLFHGVSYSRQSLTMAIDDGQGWRGYRQVNRPFGVQELLVRVATLTRPVPNVGARSG